ncbi:hypothetical protein CDAR_120121 [Caerostris darwini]|uniref:Uncharacterized protein n=1 Tax=Caerostris darwini TaxID=1538125 RepID=A0AAV4SBZ4_9ARAC|nr:hypothetical protein CDAR_120121 [Caerostris darwini]
MDPQPRNLAQLAMALESAWLNISVNTFRNLIDSLSARLASVRSAEGVLMHERYLVSETSTSKVSKSRHFTTVLLLLFNGMSAWVVGQHWFAISLQFANNPPFSEMGCCSSPDPLNQWQEHFQSVDVGDLSQMGIQ